MKVLAYITRPSARGAELLVFDHEGMPEAGTQVVAGTVERGESLRAALRREVYEEAGLTRMTIGSLIMTTDYFHVRKHQHHIRNYFHVTLTDEVPEAWSHRVSAGSEDSGLVFNYFWMPLAEAQERLADAQGQAAGRLA